jgi:hypothetical protein
LEINNMRDLPLIPSNQFNWVGLHGYIKSAAMPGDLGLIEDFAVQSGRTGAIKRFTFSHVLQDVEGRITGWLFDCKENQDSPISITVFNDHFRPLTDNDLGNS